MWPEKLDELSTNKCKSLFSLIMGIIGLILMIGGIADIKNEESSHKGQGIIFFIGSAIFLLIALYFLLKDKIFCANKILNNSQELQPLNPDSSENTYEPSSS